MGKLGACYSATLVVNSQIRCLNEEYCVEVNKFENMLMIWMQDQLLITELTCCFQIRLTATDKLSATTCLASDYSY